MSCPPGQLTGPQGQCYGCGHDAPFGCNCPAIHTAHGDVWYPVAVKQSDGTWACQSDACFGDTARWGSNAPCVFGNGAPALAVDAGHNPCPPGWSFTNTQVQDTSCFPWDTNSQFVSGTCCPPRGGGGTGGGTGGGGSANEGLLVAGIGVGAVGLVLAGIVLHDRARGQASIARPPRPR